MMNSKLIFKNSNIVVQSLADLIFQSVHYKVLMAKFIRRKKTTEISCFKCYNYKLSAIALKYLAIYMHVEF